MKKPISLAMLLFVVLAFGGFGAASAAPVSHDNNKVIVTKDPDLSKYTFNNCIVTIYIINGYADIKNIINAPSSNNNKCDNKKKCDNNRPDNKKNDRNKHPSG